MLEKEPHGQGARRKDVHENRIVAREKIQAHT